MGQRTYTDDELTRAVAAARSWRGVLRLLGLRATSSQELRSVRAHTGRLGLSAAHFTGQRRWSQEDLATAVASSRTWSEVACALGLAGGSSNAALKGHAARLGIDTSHMGRRHELPADLIGMCPSSEHLPRSGSMLAAAWFSMCGYRVSWPLEPCRYDLVAEMGHEFWRVQVKTTRARHGQSWVVTLSSTSTEQAVYDVDEIDYFFIIDGNLDYYVIPIASVGGLRTVNLSAYQQFRLSRGLPQPT